MKRTDWSWEKWHSPVWQWLSSHTPFHEGMVQDSLETESAHSNLLGSHRMEL